MSEFLHTFKCGHTTKCEYILSDGMKSHNFTIIYVHGFCSEPYGRKPEEIKKWCIKNGVGFFRFELVGHGVDQSRFEETTMNTYKSQLFEIVEDLVDGPVVFVGSSLGGWLSLLVACQFENRVIGLMGLAAFPDCLKESYFNAKQLEIFNRVGKVEFPTNDFIYTVTKDMIASGVANSILDKDVIPFKGKVYLLQGMKDTTLDWHVVLTIAEKLQSDNVHVHLIKSSNHRLDADVDIREIICALNEFLV